VIINKFVSDLFPGEAFIYKNKAYVFLKTTPMDLGASTDTANLVCAVDLDTYDIVCFDKDWEVTVYGNPFEDLVS
jgi:hypothetical protein